MLTVYDAKEMMDTLNPTCAKSFMGYFIQRDVLDVHVYRIVQGNFEEIDNGYQVEITNIPKKEIVDYFGMDTEKRSVQLVFQSIDTWDIARAVIALDAKKDFASWDNEKVRTLKEALSLVTKDGMNKIKKIRYEETTAEYEEKNSMLSLKYLSNESLKSAQNHLSQ